MHRPASNVTTAAKPSLWRRRVLDPILSQLQQGVAPDRIALTIALAVLIGTFPVIGISTVTCGIVGIALKLNQPIIQLVNYLVYPLQILLIIPYCRLGEWLFRATPVPIANIQDLLARFAADPWQFAQDYGLVGLYGIVAWGLITPFAVTLLYWLLKPLLVTTANRLGRGETTQGNVQSPESQTR